MQILTEKKAGEFLKKNGFRIVESVYVKSPVGLKAALMKIRFPCVMKVAGSKIVHKSVLGGVKIDVKNYEDAVRIFKSLKKIKGAEGVIVQRQVKGDDWYLLGIKNTPEFGHTIVFGAGGVCTEELKDVSFRIYPLQKEDVINMIEDTEVGKKASLKHKKIISEQLMKLNKLVKKFQKIEELDINPLMIDKKALIIDSRVVFY